jgi:hypothetical protein
MALLENILPKEALIYSAANEPPRPKAPPPGGGFLGIV